MIRLSHGLLARPSRALASIYAGVGLSAASVLIALASASVTSAPAHADQGRDTRIVRVSHDIDSDGNRVNDMLEQALSRNDFHALPNAVIPAHSAIAEIKGAAGSDATVVDAIVCFDHAPTQADVAALKARDFTVKDVFSRLVYAVHIVGPAPKGAQTLQEIASGANAISGVTYIGPNNAAKPLLQHSTRQIRARQSWTAYQGYNVGLPLSGDPGRAIAIMDTGLDATHPDLNGGTASTPGNKIMAWYGAYSGDATPTDVFGHGSHVAGIAAGTGQSAGIATGTGTIPLTIIGNFLGDNANIIQLNNANIPVDTTGFSGPQTITLDGYWSQSNPNETDTFVLYDQTDKGGGASVSGFAALPQPLSTSISVPQGFSGNYYMGFETSDAANLGAFRAKVDSPYTAIGDGFNLLSGVARTSSLVGIGAAQPNGEFPTDAGLRGFDYLSSNRQRYNIGVVNMSSG